MSFLSVQQVIINFLLNLLFITFSHDYFLLKFFFINRFNNLFTVRSVITYDYRRAFLVSLITKASSDKFGV